MELNQIVAGTTDNGKNMVKAIAMLDAEFQNQEQNSPELANERGCLLEEEEEEEDEVDNEIFDENYWGDMLGNVTNHFHFERTDLIHGISCAAHCIHLILTHAMDDCATTKALIEKFRLLARKLRTPTFNEMLLSRNMFAAKIDVKTRWNSIFSMVRSFGGYNYCYQQ